MMSIYFGGTTDEELIEELKHRGYSISLTDEINVLKDVIASYENQPPVAWINRDGTYVELSTKSTVYRSHTIPLIMQHEVVYSSDVPEIFLGTLDALNKLGVPNVKLRGADKRPA
jgi:hypothetical protein